MDEHSEAKKKIVVVEDNPDLAEIYKTRLDLAGYETIVTHDGIAAMYSIQNEQPDLVLLDLMVPAIAGDEVLKRLRASDWGKDIPVYVISNLSEQDAPAGLRDLGIEGYSIKIDLEYDDIDKIVAGILNK